MPRLLEDMNEMELSALMNEIGAAITTVGHYHGVGRLLFTLIVFNDPKVGQYLCNVDRKGAITAMRETADRLENKDTVERTPFPD